jgi:hypothetical protein
MSKSDSQRTLVVIPTEAESFPNLNFLIVLTLWGLDIKMFMVYFLHLYSKDIIDFQLNIYRNIRYNRFKRFK